MRLVPLEVTLSLLILLFLASPGRDLKWSNRHSISLILTVWKMQNVKKCGDFVVIVVFCFIFCVCILMAYVYELP